MTANTDSKLLRRLDRLGRATRYTVRDAQTLLAIEGYRRPSLDFIHKRFKWLRGKRIKRFV